MHRISRVSREYNLLMRSDSVIDNYCNQVLAYVGSVSNFDGHHKILFDDQIERYKNDISLIKKLSANKKLKDVSNRSCRLLKTFFEVRSARTAVTLYRSAIEKDQWAFILWTADRLTVEYQYPKATAKDSALLIAFREAVSQKSVPRITFLAQYFHRTFMAGAISPYIQILKDIIENAPADFRHIVRAAFWHNLALREDFYPPESVKFDFANFVEEEARAHCYIL